MKRTIDIKTRHLLDDVIESNLNYLVRFATIRVGDRSDAEDIVHDAVQKFLETDISKIRRESIRMYLFRIVYNLCRDFYISGRYTVPLSEEDVNIPDGSKDSTPDAEEIDRLNSLLDRLPEREAEVIRMNVIDELSFVEISQILSTPPSTIKSRFKSGMEKLRNQYLKNQ